MPREELRIRGGFDPDQVARRIAEKVPYTPPVFKRLVLYTKQFHKTPIPGRTLSQPDPEMETKGLLYGELFRAPGYTLVDIDFHEDVDTLKVWAKTLAAKDFISYPTRRGIHIYVEGNYAPARVEARFFGIPATVEVKPCAYTMCTSWYRTLNGFQFGDEIYAINGRYIIVVGVDGKVEYHILDRRPADAATVRKLLGLKLEPIEVGGELRSETTARKLPFIWKTAQSFCRVMTAEEVVELVERMHVDGRLPPCLEPIIDGDCEGCRFATLTLLVAALSAAGLCLREGEHQRLCEILVERWGGRLSSCRSKLKSILYCQGGRCVYAYNKSLLRELQPLWRCDPSRCPISDRCRSSWLAPYIIGRYLVARYLA